MMSDGHSTARSLSLIEFLNEWITHPSGTLGLNHLLIAADTELALTEIVALFNGLASPSFRVPLASLV
jgi:hypothetical protein